MYLAADVHSLSRARLLDRNAPLFDTAAVITLKRVDVPCIALPARCRTSASPTGSWDTEAKVLRAGVRPWPC
jgi:hypothetical protein